MGLDLYAKVEPLLGFEEQKERLYHLFLRKLQELKPASVLDIGCGSGRFMELAKESGIVIEGVDLSQEMVRRARAKGLPCHAVDIAQLDGRYDAAVAIFDVLNYMPREQVRRFLRNVVALLKNGGYFLADINTLFGFEEVAQGSLWVDAEERFVALDAIFEEGRLVTDIVYFHKDGDCYLKERDQIVQYYHEVEDLKVAGLSIVDIEFVSLFAEEAVDKALILFQKD